MAEIKTYAEILSEQITASGYKTINRVTDVVNDLEDINIDRRRISDYMKGLRVPKPKQAAAILRALDLEMDFEELEDILEYSKDESQRLNRELEEIRVRALRRNPGDAYSAVSVRSLDIDLSSLLDGFGSEEAKLMLNERIAELYGDEKYASRYVGDLIRKDLTELIL